jgi:hypothetical protein
MPQPSLRFVLMYDSMLGNDQSRRLRNETRRRADQQDQRLVSDTA